jgi:hypothetical protein
MYFSAMAPLRHFAMVTIRRSPWNSPTTQVHSPEPNLIGWDATWIGVPPVDSTRASIALDVLLDTACGRLPFDFHKDVVGVLVGEHAMPVGSVLSLEVELIHSLKIADYLVSVMAEVSFREPVPIDCTSPLADVRRSRPTSSPRTGQGDGV